MSFSEWKNVQLQDIVSKLGDGLHGTPKYDENGEYYFINGNNLVDGKIVIKDSTKKVSEEEFKKYKKELNDRTILLGINGTIGNVALYNNEKCILGKSACYFNVVNSVDKHFIKYVITDKGFQSYIQNTANGTTIKNVSLKSIREFEFNLPDLKTQQRIASILSCLDDAIELNQQINKTLEEMAKAIFKEWFVDFNFPNATGKFQETEIGKIPVGWKVGKLGDIYKTTSGGTPSRAKLEYYENGIYQWVKSKELNNSFIIDTEEKITEDALKKSSAKLVPKYSVMIAMYGATVGEIGIISNEATCNQAICAFLPNNDYPFSFIYQFLLLNKQDIISQAVGSAQQNISQQLLLIYALAIPPSETVKAFHKIVEPLFFQIEQGIKENQSLGKLRDTLLPKLMKGEIELSEK